MLNVMTWSTNGLLRGWWSGVLNVWKTITTLNTFSATFLNNNYNIRVNYYHKQHTSFERPFFRLWRGFPAAPLIILTMIFVWWSIIGRMSFMALISRNTLSFNFLHPLQLTFSASVTTPVWLGGQVVRTLDLRSTGREFESWSSRCWVQPWACC